MSRIERFNGFFLQKLINPFSKLIVLKLKKIPRTFKLRFYQVNKKKYVNSPYTQIKYDDSTVKRYNENML